MIWSPQENDLGERKKKVVVTILIILMTIMEDSALFVSLGKKVRLW